MADIYRIDNTEPVDFLNGVKRWVTPDKTFLIAGYVLRIFFQPLEPAAVPKAVLQQRGGLIYHDDLNPGSFVDISRWTGMVLIPRATQLNHHGGPERLFIEFGWVNPKVVRI